MSLRVKAVLIIITVVFVVVVAYFFLSLSFTRQNLVKTMEQDLSLARDIADDLVSTSMRLLKSDAITVAERLLKANSPEEMAELMESQLDEFPGFRTLTVYTPDGVLLKTDEAVCHNENLNDLLRTVFSGEAIISTTHFNSAGSFVMDVFVPMRQGMVLSASFSGMLFSDLLSGYKLWQTGSIYLIDETGAIIAHYRPELVLGRANYTEADNKADPELATLGAFIRNVLTHESGVGTYPFEGKERFCAYKRVSGSISGWRVIVAVPLSESPFVTLQHGLLLASLCFLGIGGIVAIFISSSVVKPFNMIEEQNRNLAELNELVVASSRAKSNFLANMSHEMRTPLNAIIGLSELTLGAGELTGENNENLEKICNAGMTLLSTVNDILDISKIESGKFEIIPIQYDIPSLLNDAITQSILHIGEKQIQFVLNIDPTLPAQLYGDDLRVKQIFNNLLSNAFKYTREGTVTLGVTSEREDEKVVWLVARIQDTGIGIKKEDLADLFADYSQLDKTSNRRIAGTGLGLSITKKLIDMMDSSITVESEYGKGSVFTVRLRQQSVTNAEIGREMAASLANFRYSETKRDRNSRIVRIQIPYARVLVVDDVVNNLDVAKGMMRPYGIQVDCVTSGQQAVDAIRDENIKYNAVFMDHMMPGMDGIEAARKIREDIGTDYAKNIPIIALTANAIVGNEEMFLRKGFQAFISKPIEIERLDAVIREWVRDKDLEKTITGRQIDTDGQTPDIRSGNDRRSSSERRSGIDRRKFARKAAGIDLEKGIKRLNGDEKLFLEVLRSYTVNTPPLLKSLKNASEDNLAGYAITVHGIKGSSRSIYAETIGAQAEALENAANQGNYSFIKSHNSSFIEATEKLIMSLNEALAQIEAAMPKPVKDKPEQSVLAKLLAACDTYNMDGVDAAMDEILKYEYRSGAELTAWLKENVDQMNFKEIKNRLKNLSE